MVKIAISYRRADPSKLAGRIYDRLIARYGADAVFFDRYNIYAGDDFRKVVRHEFLQADVVLAFVGSNWTGKSDGHARILDDDDPVRTEIEIAFDAGVPVRPVLIDHASMPGKANLPPSIRRFPDIDAVRVNDEDFEHHIGDLVRAIDRILGPKAPRAASASPPTGTVTFLFTEIERSRRTLGGASRPHGRGTASATTNWARCHGGASRLCLSAGAGQILNAFTNAEAAVAAAFDFQQSLTREDFSAVGGFAVRTALHTGDAEALGGTYVGPAVNRVERLLEIGYGGQVIASGVTHDLALGAASPPAAFIDLGEHRLRDLARPEQVYQLVASGLREDFPPLRSLSALPNNLPSGPLTSFVGRDREVAEVTDRLERNRLVTLVGTGGVGKTRVALQVAANLLDGRGDGVWLVELAALKDRKLVANAIANAIGIPLSGPDPTAALVAWLKTKRLLLVLDTCEHLRDAVAATASAVLRGTSSVDVLAASRVALCIHGEVRYGIRSLGVPSAAELRTLTARDALQYGAVSLFVDRAISAHNPFRLTDDNVRSAAEIARRLDGIPLAIELAAARVGSLGVHDLAKRLDDRFRILTGGSRDVLPRQQTLRALIDWSYNLLRKREKMLLQRVSVFLDGFSMDAAVAVCCDETLDEHALLELLTTLVDNSLVVAEPAAESTRYRLLQSIRAYAFEKLDAASERPRIGKRHLDWVRALVQHAKQRDDTTLREDEYEGIEPELGNVREALAWALASGDVDAGAAIVDCVCGRALYGFGSIAEWSAELERFIAALPADRYAALSLLHGWDSVIGHSVGSMETPVEAAQRSVQAARSSGDAVTLASALIRLDRALVFKQRYDEAEAALAESEGFGGPELSARLFVRHYDARGTLALARGNFDRAVAMYERVIQKYRDLGAPIRPFSFSNVAELEHARGNTDRAATLAREGLQSGGGPYDRELLFVNLAGYSLALDDVPGARQAAAEGLALLEATQPDSVMCAYPVEHLALAAALEGDYERAARLRAYTSRRIAESGGSRGFTEAVTYNRFSALLAEHLTPGDLERYGAEGRNLTAQQARGLALPGT